MNNSKTIQYLVLPVVLAVVVVLFAVQPTDAARLKKPGGVEVSYVKNGTKLRVSWNKVKGAKSYVVRIKQGKKSILRKVTSKKKATFKRGKLKQGKQLQIYVHAKKTAKKAASKKRVKKFRYYKSPTFTQVYDTAPGKPLWLFVKDDDYGDDTVMFSAEQPGSLLMGRGTLERPQDVTWRLMANADTLEGDGVADHWHIYAHGYHWVVLSDSSATQSYLLKIDKDLNIVKQITVAEDVDIEVPTGNARLATNDMFMVDEEDGVTVGHYYPAHGSQLYRYDTDLNLIETKKIGGGKYTHGNSSSAIRVKNGFWLFGIDTINNVSHSKLSLIKFDKNWDVQSRQTLVNLDSTNISMPSAVRTNNKTIIVSARVDQDAYPEGEMPPPSDNVGAPEADDGEIWQFIFSPNKAKTLMRTRKLDTEAGNRPHTALVDGQLVTTWDTTPEMRVDDISF